MEEIKANGILEEAEGCLDTPTQRVNIFEVVRRERIRRKIGDNSFKRVIRDFETNNSEREQIEARRIHILCFFRQEIEVRSSWNESIRVGLILKELF